MCCSQTLLEFEGLQTILHSAESSTARTCIKRAFQPDREVVEWTGIGKADFNKEISSVP